MAHGPGAAFLADSPPYGGHSPVDGSSLNWLRVRPRTQKRSSMPPPVLGGVRIHPPDVAAGRVPREFHRVLDAVLLSRLPKASCAEGSGLRDEIGGSWEVGYSPGRPASSVPRLRSGGPSGFGIGAEERTRSVAPDVCRQPLRASRASWARKVFRVTVLPFGRTLWKCLPRYWSKSSASNSETRTPVCSRTR